MITAGNSGGAVSQSMNSDGTATLCVTDGYVVLPTNAFAAIKNDKFYAGEIAQIGVDGTVTQVRLGSVTGNAGIAGDKRSQSDTAFLKYRTWVPLLDAIPSRFGVALKLLDAIVEVLNRDFPELTYFRPPDLSDFAMTPTPM